MKGKPLADAQRALKAAGLRGGRIYRVPAAGAAEGTVVGLIPKPGAKAARGGAVDLLVAEKP